MNDVIGTSNDQLVKDAESGLGGAPKRDIFTSNLGVIAATLGSAVGLGNIWKFPYLTGVNGGAAFIIVYILCTLFVGLPVMISELLIGRRARANAVTSLQILAPKKQPWWLVGVMGVLAAFLILAFYTEVAAWVFAYVFKALAGGLVSTDPEVTSAAFNSLVSSPLQSLLWQWVVLALIGFIIILGVSKGIEKATKRLMPVLFGLLVIICIRSLTLPGAAEGVSFLLQPNFSLLTPAVVLTAMGLAFFKLSVGMGTMITYGSYFREDQNIPGTAIRVMLADLSVSLLAGLAIFPAVFAFGFKPETGPSLVFVTIPAVFASMPMGNVFMALFAVLTAIAATGAMLSLLEVPVAFLEERTRLSRKWATVITVFLLAMIGSTAALSNSLLAGVKVFGLNFFDLYDFISSNILLPVGGLFLAVFVGWSLGLSKVRQTLTNHGVLKNDAIVSVFFNVVRFVTPILVILILLNSLGVINLG